MGLKYTREQYAELLYLIREETEREHSVRKWLEKFTDWHIVAELWVARILDTLEILDPELYQEFSYALFECGKEWKVWIGDKEYTWSDDEWFINYLMDK